MQSNKKNPDQTKIPRPYVGAVESRFLKRFILEPKKTIKRPEIHPKFSALHWHMNGCENYNSRMGEKTTDNQSIDVITLLFS